MDVYGLVGNPVGHSLSRPMHEAAYETLGMDAAYVSLEPDPEDLELAIRGADALGVAGLNVTVPFKESVLAYVEPDEKAAAVGAVNTVAFRQDGNPTGWNTDVEGVRRAFDVRDVPLEGEEAIVLGAGGAGRAAAWALAEAGASVTVVNRTVSRAETLAELVDGRAAALDALDELVPESSILVQTTTVGMESDRSLVPAEALHAELTVLDAVYRPVATRLLRDAEAVGARTIDGTRMLLYQGVEAFERWTGEDAPVAVMDQALRARLDIG
jgi:shikimate dehydrogenase